MSLITLVYVSASHHLMSDDELKAILEVSRRNNARDNITGMLLYRDGYFIQALEGEEEAVNATYAKIVRDPRHFNCIVVYRNAISQRSFASWAMGFNHISQVDPDAPEEVRDFLDHPLEPSRLTDKPTIAVHLLENFRDQNTF
jgi:hypothetical protein